MGIPPLRVPFAQVQGRHSLLVVALDGSDRFCACLIALQTLDGFQVAHVWREVIWLGLCTAKHVGSVCFGPHGGFYDPVASLATVSRMLSLAKTTSSSIQTMALFHVEAMSLLTLSKVFVIRCKPASSSLSNFAWFKVLPVWNGFLWGLLEVATWCLPGSSIVIPS